MAARPQLHGEEVVIEARDGVRADSDAPDRDEMLEDAADRNSLTADGPSYRTAVECDGFDSNIGALSDAAAQLAEFTPSTSAMGELATTSACSHAQVAHQALDDAALAAAWEYEGEPGEYSSPDELELQYLADSRRRSQGETLQRKRLHRQNTKLRRHRAAAVEKHRAVEVEEARLQAEADAEQARRQAKAEAEQARRSRLSRLSCAPCASCLVPHALCPCSLVPCTLPSYLAPFARTLRLAPCARTPRAFPTQAAAKQAQEDADNADALLAYTKYSCSLPISPLGFLARLIAGKVAFQNAFQQIQKHIVFSIEKPCFLNI